MRYQIIAVNPRLKGHVNKQSNALKHHASLLSLLNQNLLIVRLGSPNYYGPESSILSHPRFSEDAAYWLSAASILGCRTASPQTHTSSYAGTIDVSIDLISRHTPTAPSTIPFWKLTFFKPRELKKGIWPHTPHPFWPRLDIVYSVIAVKLSAFELLRSEL